MLVLDARFHYTDGLRGVLALAVYPLQRAATLPFELSERAAGYFANQGRLRDQNAALRSSLLEASEQAQRFEAAQADLERLRALLGASKRLPVKSIAAEILYNGRDPYSRKVVIDHGTEQGVRAGAPVVDASGVVGQVTRAYPFTAEVTLITDKDQAIPVQVLRTGLRAIVFGAGSSGMLDLRYMAANADIRGGDRLVTSGIDGTYPSGLAVAIVERVERDAAYAFARIVCRPAAGVERGRYVLVLAREPAPRLGAEEHPPERARQAPRARRPHRKEADGPR